MLRRQQRGQRQGEKVGYGRKKWGSWVGREEGRTETRAQLRGERRKGGRAGRGSRQREKSRGVETDTKAKVSPSMETLKLT